MRAWGDILFCCGPGCAEHGGNGGSAAAPIVQKVLARYFEKQREEQGEAVASREAGDAGG